MGPNLGRTSRNHRAGTAIRKLIESFIPLKSHDSVQVLQSQLFFCNPTIAFAPKITGVDIFGVERFKVCRERPDTTTVVHDWDTFDTQPLDEIIRSKLRHSVFIERHVTTVV